MVQYAEDGGEAERRWFQSVSSLWGLELVTSPSGP